VTLRFRDPQAVPPLGWVEIAAFLIPTMAELLVTVPQVFETTTR
jgi:hypothetical protein